MNRLRRIAKLICLAIVALQSSAATAQSATSYPNKPVRIIVPFAPGGAPSVVIRLLSERFSHEMGQNFIVENRGGGDTVIGTGAVAMANPDGYTLLTVTSTYIVNYWLSPNLPFDSLKELTPVGNLTRGDLVLVIHPAVPVKDVKDFVAHAKAGQARPHMAYAGSIGLLNYQLLMNATGIKFTPVTYKGGADAVIAVLSAESQGNLTGVANVDGFVKSGRLKALAITGSRRSPVLPDVPTFVEAGVKNFDAYNWFALLAPARTPRDVIEKMNVQVRKALEAPETIVALAKLGLDPSPTTVTEAQKFVRAEAARIGKLIKDSGLKPGDN